MQVQQGPYQNSKQHREGIRGLEAALSMPRHEASAQARAICRHHHGLRGSPQPGTATVGPLSASRAPAPTAKAPAQKALATVAAASSRHRNEREKHNYC